MDGDFNSDAVRWRLLLGQAANAALGGRLEGDCQACDAALDFLYSRDPEQGKRGIRGRQGGSEAPQLTVVDWLENIHRLFPQETIERLERDAVERYHIDEVVTNPEVLRRVQPNISLVGAVLKTRHLMNEQVLQLARELVARVVEELLRKLAREVERAFSGIQRHPRSVARKVSRDLDAKTTIEANLRHYDPERRQLVVQHPYFFPRSRRQRLPWQLILLVDQSGSMVESVIHSAVTASCLWSVPSLKTHLVVFSTEVVDLSGEITDPVETLMRVQLGGGTDIAKAVEYAASLVDNPRRCIVAVVTDFFEGPDPRRLVRITRELVAQGTTVLGLAALDPEAQPNYCREIAAELVAVGAHVAAMTPGQLAQWVAEKVAG